MDEAEFRAFLKQTLGVCASVSRDGAVHFVCMDWRHMDDVSAIGKAVYGDLLNVCVWNKSALRPYSTGENHCAKGRVVRDSRRPRVVK
jgi:hypothetical protein